MDLDAVRTFVAIADAGRFQDAATELSITQQAVSKRIAALERAVGVRLFTRTPRGAELTVDGRAFLPHARELLRAEARAFASVRPGHRALRVDVIGRGLAPATLLRDFHRAHPEIELDVVTLFDADAAVDAIRSGTVDASFRAVTVTGRRLADSTGPARSAAVAETGRRFPDRTGASRSVSLAETGRRLPGSTASARSVSLAETGRRFPGSTAPARSVSGSVPLSLAETGRRLPDDIEVSRAFDEPVQLLTGPAHALAAARTLTPADLVGHRIWMPGLVPGTEWAAYYDAFAAAFGLTIESTGPDFGVEPLLDTIAGSRSLATLVGEQTRLVWPADHDLRRIAVRNPTPVYPHSLVHHRDNRHPGLTALRDHLASTRPDPSDEGTWTPAWA
ncbi:LysR family transcriptional regulator [Streptomyces xylophagus]|uniref:LysR family transcriptional regulator n=1 Tax=Streptomyces xylophagus TaxID=285514 RepID=UPI0005BDDDD5|nr:LysR family transcriptional regulator [Streptomyces xylophagus]